MRALLTAALAAACASAYAADAQAARRHPVLPAFHSCSGLLSEARDAAQEPPIPFRGPTNWTGSDRITPRGPYDQPDPNRKLPEPTPVDDGTFVTPVSATPVSSEAAGGGDVTSSTTNVQEAGIDEPDLVKAVGGRLYVVAGTTLWALDATGDTPRVLGKLDLEGAGGTLLVEGDRALVLTARQPPQAIALAADGPTSSPSEPAPTRLTEVDLRDPGAMRILRTMSVPGDLVTARLTDGTARIVLNSSAALDGGDAGTSTTTAPANGISGRAARRLDLSAFVPSTFLKSRVTGRSYTRPLVRCAQVRHPDDPMGTDLLTVLTVDMRKGLFNVDRDAVLGSAQVVYASATGLYVASSDSAGARAAGSLPNRPITEIHEFDTTSRDETTYLASGAVPGFAIGQYALSESGGALRVATTKTPQWMTPPDGSDNESYVTVLRRSGAVLAKIGQLRGLGPTERIYAARFIGDRGYVVTFRQTDPLYVLDLSDPAAPKVAGQLKINGYSAYLHPLDDDLLLGIGADATDTGRPTGGAISLFDVADPKTPKLVSRRSLGSGSQTSVEFDPHAFLWWAPAKLALVPSTAPGDWRTTIGSVGSVTGVHIDRATGITDAGQAFHGPDWDHPMIKRSVVVGARVITLSDLGVRASALGDLAPQGFLPWTG